MPDQVNSELDATTSAAISLKRIADTLDELAELAHALRVTAAVASEVYAFLCDSGVERGDTAREMRARRAGTHAQHHDRAAWK